MLGLGDIYRIFGWQKEGLGVGISSKEIGNFLPYVDLGNGRSVLEVYSGQSHTCAKLDNFDLKCWGDGDFIGLGTIYWLGSKDSDMGDNLPPLDFGAGRNAVNIVAGGHHSCAILDNGKLKCWGIGGYTGELGDDGYYAHRSEAIIGDDPGEMSDALITVNLGTNKNATQVVVSKTEGHTCAILNDGSVKCWGQNDHGRLGIGIQYYNPEIYAEEDIGDDPGEMGDALPVVNLGSNRTSIQLAAGALHTCSILDNFDLKCWGANESGQLGLGDTADRGMDGMQMGDNLPTLNLGSNRYAKEIALGATHSCARLDNDTIKCWGGNSYGQLGLGDTKARGRLVTEMGDNLPTVNLGTGHTAKHIFAGGNHTCALLDNDTLKCWGANALGQLGIGDSKNRGDQANEMGDSLPAIDFGNK